MQAILGRFSNQVFLMAALSIHERKRLRQIGHALNPVVMVGSQGLTENVIEETNRALNDHELIKVKVYNSHGIANNKTTSGAGIILIDLFLM